MPEEHPGRETLEAFLQGELSAEENARVVRHLLTGCSECRRLTSKLWPSPTRETRRGAEEELPHDFGPMLERLEQAVASLRVDRIQAPRLLEELEGHPYPRQLLMAQNSRRYHTWAFGELVVESAYEARFSDPERAVRLAEIGAAVCAMLDDDALAGGLANDLRARAWAVLGNAYRIQSSLGAAEDAFETAWSLLYHGTGDPLEEARVHHLYGILCHARRRFQEAVGEYDRAITLYRRGREDHQVGRVLIEKGRSLGDRGELESGIRCLQEGLRSLDADREPRTALAAKHNLTLFLHESGRLDEALALLTEILPLHAEQGDAINLLRLRWLEGRLAQAQQEFGRAENAFLEVREGFVGRAMAYDAALASLDLATVYLKQGRSSELRSLAVEMLQVFRTLGIPREAFAACALFRQAVELEQLTLGLIRHLAAYFERARFNPGLTFEPPHETD